MSIQWIQFRSSDGKTSLYFNAVTKQIRGEGFGGEPNSTMDVDEDQPDQERLGGDPPVPQQDPTVEDFEDDDINAAARIAGFVRLFYFVIP